MTLHSSSRNDHFPAIGKGVPGHSQDYAQNLNMDPIHESTNRSAQHHNTFSSWNNQNPALLSDQQRQHLQFQMFDQQNASNESTNRVASQPHHYFNTQQRNIIVHPSMLESGLPLAFGMRHVCTLQKSEMIEHQRRLKNLQWLTKWDQFRSEKSIYVDRALEILKQKRRVINLIALMALVEKVRQIREHYEARKAYMRAQSSAMMIAIKCKVRYQRVFQRKFGYDMQHRMAQDIRRNFTLLGLFKPNIEKRAYINIKKFFIAAKSRRELKKNISSLCQNVVSAQLLVKQIKFMKPLRLNYAVMRFQ